MYLYDPLFFIENEDKGDNFTRVLPIGERSRAFIATCDDPASLDIAIAEAERAFRNAKTFGALLALLKKSINWSGKKAQFALLDMDAGEFECSSINAPPILTATRDGRINKLGGNDTDSASAPDFAYSEKTGKISAAILTLDPAFAALAENHIPFCYSRKEINAAVKNFVNGRDYSFCFINFEIGRNKMVSRARSIESNLFDIKSVENDLEMLLRQHIPHDDFAATNILLNFHELIINAFEHGSLNLDPSKKQEMIAIGEYDGFIERSSNAGKIHCSFDCYENGFIRIAITDEGAGFDYEETLKTIEEVRSADAFSGRGLKLVYQNCAALFFSNGGRTSTFFSRANLESRVVPSEEAALSFVTLLYVDDDEFVLLSVERLLKRAVRTLLLAKDGAEALELFKMYKPDIVVTDVEMPILDGLELAEKIREIDKFAPIVVTTAHSDERFYMWATDVGIDRVLTKPVRFPTVRAALTRFALNCCVRNQRLLPPAPLNLTNELRAALIRDDSEIIDGAIIKANVKNRNLYGVIKIDRERTLIYLWASPFSIAGAAGAAFLSAIADRIKEGETLADIARLFYEKIAPISGASFEIFFALANSDLGEIEVINPYESAPRKVDGRTVSLGDEISVRLL